VIFGSVESGPELGTETLGVVVDGVGVTVGILVGGGLIVCAWSGAGTM
jgi:hypothetical protein